MASGVETAFLEDARAFTKALDLPAVSIEVKNLTIRRRVPILSARGPASLPENLMSTVRKIALLGLSKAGTHEINLLEDVTLSFPAGTSTLILGSPGSGKSTLLRALGGRVPDLNPEAKQAIYWNGHTKEALEGGGVKLNRLTAYAPQQDEHQQFLTVGEVLHFCHDNSIAEAGLSEEQKKAMSQRVERAIELLGLSVCKDVKMAMGVSGGQKRRTTVGETLLSGARVICGDQITDGLDAAVAISVVKLITDWAKSAKGTFVTALQAPPPEIFALFDRVVVMGEGKVLFEGPPALLEGYYRVSCGFHQPANVDVADYAVSVATSPSTALGLYQQQGKLAAEGVAAGSSFGLPMRFDPVAFNVASLAAHWQSHGKADLARLTAAAAAVDASLLPAAPDAASTAGSFTSAHAKAQFSGGFAHSVWRHTALLFRREGTLYGRNIGLIMAKVQQSLILGLIIGGVFYQVPFYSFFLKVSILFFALIQVSYSNIAEVPLVFENKKIVGRQLANGLYPAFAYVLALITVQLPIVLFADLIFSICLYFMTGFVNNAGNFFFFYFVIVAMDLAMTGLFKLYAILAPSEELAGVAAGAGTGLLLVYGGFFVPRQQLITEGQTIPLYYFSPFSWALRSLSLNEFMSPPWEVPAPGAGAPYPGAPPAGTTFGQYASTIFGLFYTSSSAEQTAFDWKISGPFVLLGYFCIFGLGACSLALALKKPVYSIGTRRLEHQQGAKGGALTSPSMASLPGSTPAAPIAPASKQLTIRVDPPAGASAAADEESAVPAAGAGPEGMFSPTAVAPPTPFVYSPATGEPASSPAEAAETPAAEGGPASVPDSQTVTPPSPSPAAVGEVAVETTAAAPAPAEDAVVAVVAVAPAAATEPQAAHHHHHHHHHHDSSSPAHSTTQQHHGLPFEPATLVFKDVTYSVPDPKTKGKTQIPLLRGISGVCRPGSLTALMGASGAGKTTLLDVLADRKNRGIVGGVKTVNGQILTPATSARIAAYAEQFDEALPQQTVWESLMFSAQLRMAPTVSKEDRVAQVEQALEMMELAPVRNRTVESLSPGERKRLTLGIEICSNPSILFADEPTTSLDARAAASVVRALHRIANSGRTVVVTIHQPSSAVFLAFSHLILLAPGGWQIYSGLLGESARELVAYLQGVPGVAPLPHKTNAATWMLEESSRIIQEEKNKAKSEVAQKKEIVTGAGADAAGVELTAKTAITANPSEGGILAASWKNSEIKAIEDREIAAMTVSAAATAASGPVEGAGAVTSAKSASFLKQIILLTWRGIIERWRSENSVIRVLVFIFVGIFFGVSFLDAASPSNSYTQAGGLAKIGVLFSVTVFAGIASFNSGLPSLFKVRPTFYRERAARFYHPLAYFGSLALADAPFLIFYVLLYSSICYFAVGLSPTAGPFFSWVLGLFLLLRWYEAVALWISAVMPNQQVAQIIAGMTITFSNLFAGINIPPSDLAKGWIWLFDINGLSKLLQFNSMVQFNCDVAPCPQVAYTTNSGQLDVQTPLQWASARLTTSTETQWNSLGWLVLITVVFYILGGLGYAKIVHQKR